ncbi:MAG: hypothetical protein K8S15_01975 [Candidatus Aegiribacteria sp.]|nr:hypothetical protein [Candidatus Aegiribacteria sp.]
MTVLIILFALFVLEEIFHRLNRGSSFMDVDLACESVEQVEKKGIGRFTRLLSWIRTVQLLVFCLLFAVIAALSGIRVLYTAAGQLAGLLLLIQVVRILNRKVINQWAVLGFTVTLQVFLLILLIFTGITPAPDLQYAAHDTDWVVSLVSFVLLFLLSITIPFTATYYLRLFAREGSGFYYFLPSLAYSEYWIRRLTRIAANTALVSLLILAFLIVKCEYPAGAAILHITLVFLLFTTTSLFRNRLRLHHPAAVSLVLAAWILNIVWVLANLTSVSSNWIA